MICENDIHSRRGWEYMGFQSPHTSYCPSGFTLGTVGGIQGLKTHTSPPSLLLRIYHTTLLFDSTADLYMVMVIRLAVALVSRSK